MHSPIFLKTENELNKVLKAQKKTKEDLSILFISLWDKHSETILKRISNNKRFKKRPQSKPLYVVDSFTMPHAFVIFKTTKIPHLIQFRKGSIESEDYLSKVYETLGL